jgi:hypothetical protein
VTGTDTENSVSNNIGGTLGSGKKGAVATETVKPALHDDVASMRAARQLVTDMVEKSIRVYWIIYSALPVEISRQVDTIPRGYAYGLWRWLMNKDQLTEQDRGEEPLLELEEPTLVMLDDSHCASYINTYQRNEENLAEADGGGGDSRLEYLDYEWLT